MEMKIIIMLILGEELRSSFWPGHDNVQCDWGLSLFRIHQEHIIHRDVNRSLFGWLPLHHNVSVHYPPSLYSWPSALSGMYRLLRLHKAADVYFQKICNKSLSDKCFPYNTWIAIQTDNKSFLRDSALFLSLYNRLYVWDITVLPNIGTIMTNTGRLWQQHVHKYYLWPI